MRSLCIVAYKSLLLLILVLAYSYTKYIGGIIRFEVLIRVANNNSLRFKDTTWLFPSWWNLWTSCPI
jgi:hypothetical protein